MLHESLHKVAGELRALGESRKQAVELLKKNAQAISLGSFDFLEPHLTLPVLNSRPPTAKIMAVDGGIMGEELHSLDLFVAKACAVMFDYKEGVVQDCKYHPSPFPPYEYFIQHSLQSFEFNWHKNLIRVNAELQCTVEAFEKLEPDVLFLDGSIVPQVGDKPSRDSPAYAEYEKALEKWQKLYSLADERGAALLGIIKDSRGKHFLELLQNSMPELREFAHALEKTNDTTFLHSLLQVGERTPAFKYSSQQSEKTVLRDLGEWSKKVASFYVKPVEYDRPLRVDFLLPREGSSEKISQYASLVAGLSSENKSYAYPGILIEADLRAAMEPREMEIAQSTLTSELGLAPELFKLRRNSRPFR